MAALKGKTTLILACGCRIEDLPYDVYDALDEFEVEDDRGTLGWRCPKHGHQIVTSLGRRYW